MQTIGYSPTSFEIWQDVKRKEKQNKTKIMTPNTFPNVFIHLGIGKALNIASVKLLYK